MIRKGAPMSGKILAVDDENAVLTLLKHAFSRAGYEARTAETAEAAFKKNKRWKKT